MRIIDGFKLRTVAGEKIVAGEGVDQINFNKLIAMNESSAYLWEAVDGRDFTVETLAELLVKNYIVEMDIALKDAKIISDSWFEAGLITM